VPREQCQRPTSTTAVVTPVTAESIARAKAAAARERAECDRLIEQLREQGKEDLVRLCDIWSVEVVDRWVQNIKASLGGLSPSTTGDPRR
jgi:hypothetical protein